jgi:hypothetical protein
MNDPVPLHSSLPFAPFLAIPEAPPKSYPSPLSFRDGFSERHLLGCLEGSGNQLSSCTQSYFWVHRILRLVDALVPSISKSKDSGYRFRERRRCKW